MSGEYVGYVIWEGRSAFDGAPVVLIATGLGRRGSSNAKTGEMVQTWILRTDVAPMSAVASGSDRSICGLCPYASGNGCYVNVSRAPTAIYKRYLAGLYSRLSPIEFARQLCDSGRPLRCGAYGDPAAVPYVVWRDMLMGAARGWTGYTHAWRDCDPAFRSFLMASCDSPEDTVDARAAGWRSFRVRQGVDDGVMGGEIVCPASTEGGHRAQCADCRLCAGSARPAKDIAIMDHGKFAPKGKQLAMAR